MKSGGITSDCLVLALPSIGCAQLEKGALLLTRKPRVQPKATPVPVDIPPPAHVAGPIPHFRKFAFLIGATAAMLVLVLVSQLVGLMS